jgi:chromosome segregation ATPase
MAITKEQIFAVADELDATGQNPTLAAVRKVIGGGSFTTISEAMTEWRAGRAAKAAPIREPAPQAITERLGELGAELWASALDLANGRLAAEREALEAARDETEAARQEASELADQLSVELDEAKTQIAALEASEAAVKSEANELRAKLSAAIERAAVAEARSDELRVELDRAHTDARSERAEHERQAAAHAQSDAALREAHAQTLSTLRAELATVTATAEAERAAHAEQRKTNGQEAARQVERFAAVQTERDDARKDAATARREASEAREELASVRGELHAVQAGRQELLNLVKSGNDKGEKGAESQQK